MVACLEAVGRVAVIWVQSLSAGSVCAVFEGCIRCLDAGLWRVQVCAGSALALMCSVGRKVEIGGYFNAM